MKALRKLKDAEAEESRLGSKGQGPRRGNRSGR
jgi:hypothetical protein